MRLQGKVLNWNDDKGFGFVEPNGGGERIFVHIKAFKPRSRRPVNGDLIIYDVVRDNNNRGKAENIKFSRDVKASHKQSSTTSRRKFGHLVTGLFIVGLLFSTFTGKLVWLISAIYLLMSMVTYMAYAIDKSAAQNGRWRTKESTLHLLSLVGGWPGAFLAQNTLRHKSSKKEFKNMFWFTVLLNLGGFFWLHTESGVHFTNNVILPLLSR
ncbi:DUF1294 domain-containing protein [Psychromonas sp. B3M02]|uniref:DUF1294 domain-containing protein n=1 Tax=Psychromonas sp. B3M02 TaxID=2267226 RepID=UPI000DE8EAE5|nr:cold shock and DUF1294 domain-containing protein [Psychromonas sp. B3M02]RBW46713.1 DUF1294 domain-containing protein [Psychromonas sp. B3M02]